MTKLYDPKCEDLARIFLSDSPELDMEKLAPVLAAEISETIANFIEAEKTPQPTFDFLDV